MGLTRLAKQFKILLTKFSPKKTFHFTCGSLRKDVTPPPPNASSSTKLNALIPGSSYLQRPQSSLIK